MLGLLEGIWPKTWYSRVSVGYIWRYEEIISSNKHCVIFSKFADRKSLYVYENGNRRKFYWL